ncbi:MAG: hypothetical protein EU530_08770 [Promethearchaeota archaeon]|nr:MAG: hypothetical protein EU530_08770 [Candidatus Lokiarchaeota archaeon]
MRRTTSKYILLAGTVLVLLFSAFAVVNASEDPEFTDSFPLQTFDFRMYVVSLKLGDTLIVNVTSVADGDFDLFLFSTRPTEAYVSRDGYNSEIYNPSWNLAYDNSTGTPFSSINFTADNPDYPNELYYLQVVLIDRGPDSYFLQANHKLDLYFIPFIPGYPIFTIVGFSFLTIGMIFFQIRKSMIKG